MTHVVIPASIEEATSRLDGLGKLLIAKEWERAAIVYAFTRDGRGKNASSSVLDCVAFANLGISGLKSHSTVEAYRRAWRHAIDDGQAAKIAPGDRVALPTLPFPPNPKQHTSTTDEVVARVRANPDVMREILADPAASAVVHEVVSEDLHHVSAINQKVSDRNVRYTDTHAVPHPRVNHDERVVAAVDMLVAALQAEKHGDWTPTGTTAMLLHFIGRLLSERSEPQGVPAELFDEIDGFLKEEAAR